MGPNPPGHEYTSRSVHNRPRLSEAPRMQRLKLQLPTFTEALGISNLVSIFSIRPPQSAGLNPVDERIWSVLQGEVPGSSFPNYESLKAQPGRFPTSSELASHSVASGTVRSAD